MVQPFNYSLGVASPTESFLAGMQTFQNQQQVNARREQAAAEAAAQQAKIDEANNFKMRAQEVRQNPTPENLSALYADFPTYGDDINRFAKSLNETDKRTYGSILQRAIIAKQNGATPEAIAEIYSQGAITARNSNRTDIAERFDAAASFAKNPKMDDDFAARSLLSQFDPDAYKVAYEQKDPFIVAGNNIYSRRQAIAMANEAEKIGSDLNIKPIYPEGAVAALKANPNLAGQFDAKYGTPANPNPSSFILGGQTERPSGTFQGQ